MHARAQAPGGSSIAVPGVRLLAESEQPDALLRTLGPAGVPVVLRAPGSGSPASQAANGGAHLPQYQLHPHYQHSSQQQQHGLGGGPDLPPGMSAAAAAAAAALASAAAAAAADPPYVRYVGPTPDDMDLAIEYDLDEEDEQWLEAYNEQVRCIGGY